MKVLFIEARKKFNNFNIDTSILKNFSKIHLLYSIQYKELAEKIKERLGKRIVAFQQVLGCSKIQKIPTGIFCLSKSVDNIDTDLKISPKTSLLLIGSGNFHAIQLALSTNKEVFVLENNLIRKISNEEILKLKQKKKAGILKFLNEKNIGILVSTKPGQENFALAEKLKKEIEKKGKKAHVFVSDNLQLSELENFPVKIFVNTACPGIFLDDNKIVNYEDVLEYV